MALFVVSTPIGNLKDVTKNALEILAKASLILCENTINTHKMLSLYGIFHKKTANFTDHTKEDEILKHLEFARTNDVALVCDAGTPCICDPGYKIIKLAHENGIKIHPIVGASSLISSLSVCGLPLNKFAFLSFYEKEKLELAQKLLKNSLTIAFFLPARDILKTLPELASLKTEKICIARELTKLHEDIKLGTFAELTAHYSQQERLKGEAVIILAPLTSQSPQQEEISLIIQRIFAKKPFLKALKIKECAEVLREYEEDLQCFSRKEIYNTLLKHS